MSICDSLCSVIDDQAFDKSIYSKFEEANKLFEHLVQSGIIKKRGYQLLSLENRICGDIKINYQKD